MWGVARWQAVEYGLPAARAAHVLAAQRRRPARDGPRDGLAGLPLGHRRRRGRRVGIAAVGRGSRTGRSGSVTLGTCPSRPADRVAARGGDCWPSGGVLGAALVLGCPLPASAGGGRRRAGAVPDHRPAAARALRPGGGRRPAARDQRRRRPAGGLPARRRLPGRRRAHRRRSTPTTPRTWPSPPTARCGWPTPATTTPIRADGRADRAAAGRVDRRLPADLSRRPARRRGAAAGAGRHALPRHQGDPRRERRLPARRRRWWTAGRWRWRKVAAVNLTFTGTAGGPVGQAGQLLVTGGAVARGRQRARPAHLHRRLRLAADRLRRAGRAGRRAGADPAAGLAAGRGDQLHARTTGTSLVASEGLPSDVTVVPLAAGDRGRADQPAAGAGARA